MCRHTLPTLTERMLWSVPQQWPIEIPRGLLHPATTHRPTDAEQASAEKKH